MPGGICENEGKHCKDSYATCIDGCCICNTGTSLVGGSCTPSNVFLCISVVFSTGPSKAVNLLQLFFARASLVSHVAFCPCLFLISPSLCSGRAGLPDCGIFRVSSHIVLLCANIKKFGGGN